LLPILNFVSLSELNITGISDVGNQYWIPLAEQGIKLIYNLSDHPDIVCADVVKKLAGEVMRLNNQTQSEDKSEEDKGRLVISLYHREIKRGSPMSDD